MFCHNCPAKVFLSQLSYIFWLSCLSFHGYPVLIVLPQLFCPVFSSRPAVPFLPRLFCYGCPVPTVLSSRTVLSQLPVKVIFPSALVSMLSCPYCPLSFLSVLSPGCPVLTVLSWMPCPRWHILAVLPLCLSSLTFQAKLSSLTCTSCHVRLYCPGCPATVILSQYTVPVLS
jgi:hypothetical protein